MYDVFKNSVFKSAVFFLFVFFATTVSVQASLPETTYSEIVKSPYDKRTYRYFTLGNGIRVALVHSANTETAAAAVGVHVGHQQNPDEWPGLAHLLEHMLFLGSEKYPDANSFDEFISSQGGSSNAFTSNTDTVFFIDIPNNHLFPALERMSWFFRAPLLDPEYLDRERHAVDSEFQINRQKDLHRLYMVEKFTSNPAHPIHRFADGNLQTLQDHDGLKLREALQTFHHNWYVGENISVVLVSHHSLDDMEKEVRAQFSHVTSRSSAIKPKLPPRFTKEQLGVRIDVQGQQQHKQIDIVFPLAVNPNHQREKTTGYLSHILAHEAKGTLHHVLKEKGWIQALDSWGGDDGTEALLDISIRLTDEGFKHIEEIVAQVFAYLSFIKKEGVTQELFHDLQQQQELRFRFLEEDTPENTAIDLVTAMPDHTPGQLIQSQYLIHDFNPKRIAQILESLTPDNMILRVITDSAPDVPEKDLITETWTETLYSVRKLSDKQKKAMVSAALDPALSLPPLNPYMPEELTLVEEDESDYPEPITASGVKAWFKHDQHFQIPRNDIFTQFHMPDQPESPKQEMLLALFTNIFNNRLNDTLYLASLANQNYGIRVTNQNFMLQASGYNDKLPSFYLSLLQHLKEFTFEDGEFEQEREEILEALENTAFRDPHVQLRIAFAAIRHTYSSTPQQAIEELKTITPKELRTWHESLFSHISAKTLIHGNMKRNTAENLIKELTAFVGTPAEEQPSKSIRKLPDNLEIKHCSRTYKNSDASLLVVTASNTKDIKTRATYRLLNTLLREPFYSKLRTEEQLGYLVTTMFWEDRNYPALAFFIQSPEHEPAFLDQQTTAFLTSYNDEIQSLTQEQLTDIKEGHLSHLKEPHTSLHDQSADYWSDIAAGFTGFDQAKQLAEAIRQVSIEDIQQLYQTLFSGRNQVTIYGYSDDQEPDTRPLPCNDPVFTKQFEAQ